MATLPESPTPKSVIVVGGGTAGSVVARRLVDGGMDVTVLEAGGPDTNPAIHDVRRLLELWHGPEDWDYHTIPQLHAGNRRLHLPRGKVLGGSHALNVMIWVRGARHDFDHWAELGNEGWGWEDVLPVYKEIERFAGGASEWHGADGPLEITDDVDLKPIQQAIIDAAAQAGIPFNPDYNGANQAGISKHQITVRDGQRLTTYTAYLQPVQERVRIETGCWVHELLFAATEDSARPRVIGVRYEQDGQLHDAYADEVVLTAGALDTPRVLLRSGIGPAEHLTDLGIDVIHDLPGVGQNLHDHLLVPVVFSATRQVGGFDEGQSVAQTHFFWSSTGNLDHPDIQPNNISAPVYGDTLHPVTDNGFSFMAGHITPKSRGTITLSGPGPHDPLLIDLNVLGHEDDLKALIAAVSLCRTIGAQPALVHEWGAAEIYPGPSIGEDADLAQYVRDHVETYHHQVGTCAMGTGEHAVVTPRLHIHGIDGIRVADASIMPTITTGNTMAPVVLIAEMAARFILAEHDHTV